MFDNLDELSYVVMCEVVVDLCWYDWMGVVSVWCCLLLMLVQIYVLLWFICFCVDVWCMIYYYLLVGQVVIVEWFKGLGLCFYFVLLELVEQQDFLFVYLDCIVVSYFEKDGLVLLFFLCVFLVVVVCQFLGLFDVMVCGWIGIDCRGD